MSFTVGSLFAGVGGFDMGLEAAGFEVAWQVEIDNDAVSVLERHYPNVRRYRDVRDVKGVDLPPVDVLIGGFPCQDLSVAGTRKGLAGSRSGLFFEVARIAAESSAPWLLLENVDGLLSSWITHDPPPANLGVGQRWESDESSSLGIVLSTLADGGYGWAYRVLDAQYFGVPQRRRRAFIVGCLGDTGARAAEVLFEPESVLWDLAACLTPREGSAGVSEDSVGSGGVANSLLSYAGRNQLEQTYVPAVSAPLTAGGHPSSNAPGRHREDDENLVATFDERNITSPADRSRCEPGLPSGTLHTEPHSVVTFTNRGVDGDVHESLLAGSHGALPMVADSWSVRRLMPIECERLMGWPDRWTERRADGSLIPDGPRYRMIGNGVVSSVSAWIGRRLLAVLEGREP